MANLFNSFEEFQDHFKDGARLVIEETNPFNVRDRELNLPPKRKLHQFNYGDKQDWLRYCLLVEGIELSR